MFITLNTVMYDPEHKAYIPTGDVVSIRKDAIDSIGRVDGACCTYVCYGRRWHATVHESREYILQQLEERS